MCECRDAVGRYLEFKTSDGRTVLVEVDAEEVPAGSGPVKAGRLGRAADAVAEAQETFSDAVERVVRENVGALHKSVEGLARKPDEFEITFALKATGELGNIAIGKLGGEANLEVRIAWKGDGGNT